MKDVKFSIIVPCFNTEKYIRECIESVINQNYSNYELIIVDDGSSDKTFEIAQGYEKDDFIKVKRIEHKGVSAARNCAMKLITGDYVMFLDSDDYFKPNTLQKLNRLINRYPNDVYISEFESITENKKISVLKSEHLNSQKINNLSQDKVLNYLYMQRLVFTLWRFVIKSEIILNNNLFLREGIVHEDEDWVPQMLLLANSYRKIPFTYYVYRKRENSIMSNKTLLNYHSLLEIADHLLTLAEQQKEEYKYLFYLRNAYKLSAEAYMGIRKMSKPHLCFRHYKRGIKND